MLLDVFSSCVAACRCHALSVSNQHISDVDSVGDDVEDGGLQYRYRNYNDAHYSIYVDVVRMSVRSCPQVSSKVEKPLNLPITVCSAACAAVDGRLCKLKVTLYPQVNIHYTKCTLCSVCTTLYFNVYSVLYCSCIGIF